ncbi:MAG: lytic transglycosylase domain-containing protein [Elusimicrobia bacterium]|nr:lytic transglycosylase domain-containing protein [Elusimicrobiota bacterium]
MLMLALPVRAQEPRSPLATHGGKLLAMAFPAGAAAPAGRLNQIFDAARARAGAVPGPKPAVIAPARARREPAPLEAVSVRPSAATLHQELVVPVPEASPAYRRTFRRLLANPRWTDRWDELILKYARFYHVDARLVKSIMAAESEFRSKATSPVGARGLMQVMPATSGWMGVPADSLYDPEMGVKAGTAYLQYLLKRAWRRFHLRGVRYTDAPHWVIQRVVAAYHAGPRFLTRSRWYRSTRSYVRKVLLFYRSKVTDLRRPGPIALALPSFAETVAPSGIMN